MMATVLESGRPRSNDILKKLVVNETKYDSLSDVSLIEESIDSALIIDSQIDLNRCEGSHGH